MIILERPYVSDELKDYLAETGLPVLKNDTAIECGAGYPLNLVDECDFRETLNKGGKLYTVSENALEWVYDNVADRDMVRGIRIMKNKADFRRVIKTLYPDFFFEEVSADALKDIAVDALKMPFVLKPAVGFFSVGVYTVFDESDWKAALKDIDARMEGWKDDYPDSVVGNATFILEEYVRGDEYAIDAYFDDAGRAIVLNIMKHDFTSADDVRDRLYYTGKTIIETWLRPFTDFLNTVNGLIGVRNFPLHVEVRVDGGRIVPIEFNPMRFAGWCTTDLVDFAFGVKTYDYFLNGRVPDWGALLDGKDGRIYSFVILDKPKTNEPIRYFDYEALRSRFGNVLHLRRMDHARMPVFGFLFVETDESDRRELDAIMASDLTEFIC